MTIKGFLASVAAITPTLVLGWVSSWYDLFKDTLIMRPGASDQVANTGIAFSCLLAIAFGLLLRHWSAKALKTAAVVLLIASATLAFMSYVIRYKYHFPLPRGPQEQLNFWWDLFSWVFVVLIIQLVLFSAMFATSTWAEPEKAE